MKEYLDPPIAYGRTAEIYAWQNGQVLKLFYDWFKLEAIQYEQRIVQTVHASGLPVLSTRLACRACCAGSILWGCR